MWTDGIVNSRLKRILLKNIKLLKSIFPIPNRFCLNSLLMFLARVLPYPGFSGQFLEVLAYLG